ncbi:hypothetical protein NDU88_012564, partial [Pleurodeles waltl]
PRPHRVPTDFITSCAQIALERNYFLFNDEFFAQIKGVAMGAIFVPDIANLYLATFEEYTIYKEGNPYGNYITKWLGYL